MSDPWWWFSFADPERPKGSQFLGVCLLTAADFVSALLKSKAFGINPGGEVMGFAIAPVDEEGVQLLSSYGGQLLSEKEKVIEMQQALKPHIRLLPTDGKGAPKEEAAH